MSFDDYEDEDESLETPAVVTPPVALPLPSEVSVPITVYAAQMQEQILRQVAAQVTKLFESKVAETVESAVADLVEQISREQIGEAIRAVLAEGWPTTDEYGGIKGRASLKDRISKLLNQHDRYSGRGTWAENIVTEETKRALNNEIKAELEKATAKIREEVDTVARAKLGAALRQALGVA